MAACTAPVENLGSAIVAVAAQQDFGSRPVCVNRTHQAAQKSSDFLALWPFRRAQCGGDEAPLAIEHDDGLEAIFIMMGIEQAQLLSAMHGAKRFIRCR